MEFKKLLQTEKADAMQLAWKVFQEFESPDYTAEGIITFHDFINNGDVIKHLVIYGAYEKENLVGMIATRNDGAHISLFFVDGKFHGRRIGRKLFKMVLAECTSKIITVNSSPYANEIYHKLGFIDTDMERTRDGIRYTPMKYTTIHNEKSV